MENGVLKIIKWR